MTLFFLIMIVVGILIYSFGLVFTIENIQSKRWKHVKGTITKSELIKEENKQNASKRRQPFIYTCNIEYKYKPENNLKYFKNDKIVLQGSYQSGNTSIELCDYLVINEEVDVYYNPNNPKKSYLVYQPIFPFFIMMFVGLFIILMFMTLYFDFMHKDLKYVLDLVELI